MHKDVVSQPILHLKRKPIKETIFKVPFSRVHIVGSKYNSFTQQLVINHQGGSIEELEFVIPQDVKNRCSGVCSKSEKPTIISQHSKDLAREISVPVLLSAQIIKPRSRTSVQLRAIHFITSDKIHDCIAGDQS